MRVPIEALTDLLAARPSSSDRRVPGDDFARAFERAATVGGPSATTADAGSRSPRRDVERHVTEVRRGAAARRRADEGQVERGDTADRRHGPAATRRRAEADRTGSDDRVGTRTEDRDGTSQVDGSRTDQDAAAATPRTATDRDVTVTVVGEVPSIADAPVDALPAGAPLGDAPQGEGAGDGHAPLDPSSTTAAPTDEPRDVAPAAPGAAHGTHGADTDATDAAHPAVEVLLVQPEDGAPGAAVVDDAAGSAAAGGSLASLGSIAGDATSGAAPQDAATGAEPTPSTEAGGGSPPTTSTDGAQPSGTAQAAVAAAGRDQDASPVEPATPAAGTPPVVEGSVESADGPTPAEGVNRPDTGAVPEAASGPTAGADAPDAAPDASSDVAPGDVGEGSSEHTGQPATPDGEARSDRSPGDHGLRGEQPRNAIATAATTTGTRTGTAAASRRPDVVDEVQGVEQTARQVRPTSGHESAPRTDLDVTPATGTTPATARGIGGAARGTVPGTILAARVEAAVEALRNAPPPREAVIDVDGVRITLRLVGETVHVHAGQPLDHGQQRDLGQALANRGFGFADDAAADDTAGGDAGDGDDGSREPRDDARGDRPRVDLRQPSHAPTAGAPAALRI